MDHTVNRFRKARGRKLQELIKRLRAHLGRDVHILDVGGRPLYWRNVEMTHVAHVRILNSDPGEWGDWDEDERFSWQLGDARNLSDHADKSVDLVHANSVIEHVGSWSDMQSMAREVRRVGIAGWIQTPAWEFPIEPHYRLPAIHWLGQPLRRRLLMFSKKYRNMDIAERRYHVDRINLLAHEEMATLFPNCTIMTERLVFAKSYTATWMAAS